MLSQWQLKRKARPGIRAQNGTRFPNGGPSGKRIPESKLEMGFIFLMTGSAENATRNLL